MYLCCLESMGGGCLLSGCQLVMGKLELFVPGPGPATACRPIAVDTLGIRSAHTVT